MRFLIFFPLFIIFFSYSNAQNLSKLKEIDWQTGMITLQNGQSLEGSIYYNGDPKSIYFKNEELFRVFHQHQIDSMGYYDEKLELWRKFTSLPIYSNAKKSTLLETIIDGKYKLLRVPKPNLLATNDVNSEYFSNVQRYYLRKGGQLIAIRNFKKQFEPLFLQEGIDLNELIKKKKFNAYKLADQVKLVAYLNQHCSYYTSSK